MALLAAGAMAAQPEPRGPDGRKGDKPQGGPGGGCMSMGEGRHGPMGRPPMDLDLERAKQAGATDSQIQTLTGFQIEQQLTRIDLQANADKADLKLGTLLKAQTPDEKAILQAADSLSAARSELFKLEIASMLKAKLVLGDAILKKLHDMGPPPRPTPPGMSGPHDEDQNPGDRNEKPDQPPDVK